MICICAARGGGGEGGSQRELRNGFRGFHGGGGAHLVDGAQDADTAAAVSAEDAKEVLHFFSV